MLKGFEDITVDLEPDEEFLARDIARGLNARVGKDKAITNKQIRHIYKTTKGITIGDPKMRKMVQFIRANNLVPCLCASSLGYYRAETEKEWEDWKESMRQRIRQQQFTLACAEFFNDGHEKL